MLHDLKTIIEKRKFFTCLDPNKLVVLLGQHMILLQTEEALPFLGSFPCHIYASGYMAALQPMSS